MTWYGRGPQETYQDRKTAARVGLYSGPVKAQVTPYVRPQENGNKTDVRWVSFTSPMDTGIKIVCQPLIDASAWPYTQADLETAKHDVDLPQRDTITVNIDL